MEISYTQLLKLTKEYKKNSTDQKYHVSFLSNIIVNQIEPFIEYELQKNGVNAITSFGNYDNILQDSLEHNESDAVMIFWELCNIRDGFQYKANLLNEKETSEIIQKIKLEIDFLVESLRKAKLVIINKFSSLLFNSYFLKKNNFDWICEELNNYLENKILNNFILIDIDKVIARVSVERSIELRNFYSSKALYSIAFYNAYAKYIAPIILAVLGKSKKALILDCDNTIWSGILGEDGIEGIQMSSQNKKGVVFEEIQALTKSLAQKGIIIGLNSKNNEEDVNAVIRDHKEMTLQESDIVIKRVNWNDKVYNLKEIAKQLNIGRDSIVFIDDSDFEINLVNQYLPEVKTIQVPERLYEYPSLIRSRFDDFYNIKETKDDLSRIKSYQTESLREESKSEFGNIEEYLKSLNLEMVIYTDSPSLIDRMAQLTQKTNQFNLTTKRYTVAEMENFVNDSESLVLAFEVNDRFGGFGITGCSVVMISGDKATIDTFLMSCRVLGRNIEIKFLEEIMVVLGDLGVKNVDASYSKTLKNEQVSDFYDRAGFKIINQSEDRTDYSISLQDYKPRGLNYIKVNYERQN
jgi:FkbH-like protein